MLDPQLRETNPTLYEHVLDFAKSNQLKVGEKEEEENHHSDEGDQRNEKK